MTELSDLHNLQLAIEMEQDSSQHPDECTGPEPLTPMTDKWPEPPEPTETPLPPPKQVWGPGLPILTAEAAVTTRYNQGKPQLSYILEFGRALDLVAGVMERGAMKYDRKNWQLGGENMSLESILDSVMRHLKASLSGEVFDRDMKTDHLANAACGILFALYHHGMRPKGE